VLQLLSRAITGSFLAEPDHPQTLQVRIFDYEAGLRRFCIACGIASGTSKSGKLIKVGTDPGRFDEDYAQMKKSGKAE